MRKNNQLICFTKRDKSAELYKEEKDTKSDTIQHQYQESQQSI